VSPKQEILRSLLTSHDEDHEDDAESLQVTYGGDAGEAIDVQTGDAYRKRLKELKQRLDDANELDDVEGRERIMEEMEIIKRELSASTRPDGRPRREKAIDKRAYDAVNKALKKTQDDLSKHCAEFGQHLDECIQYKRGDGWTYQPRTRIDWIF
jgi:hypothetical protein